MTVRCWALAPTFCVLQRAAILHGKTKTTGLLLAGQHLCFCTGLYAGKTGSKHCSYLIVRRSFLPASCTTSVDTEPSANSLKLKSVKEKLENVFNIFRWTKKERCTSKDLKILYENKRDLCSQLGIRTRAVRLLVASLI